MSPLFRNLHEGEGSSWVEKVHRGLNSIPNLCSLFRHICRTVKEYDGNQVIERGWSFLGKKMLYEEI